MRKGQIKIDILSILAKTAGTQIARKEHTVQILDGRSDVSNQLGGLSLGIISFGDDTVEEFTSSQQFQNLKNVGQKNG